MPLLLSVKLCHVGELKILSVDCPDVTVAVFYIQDVSTEDRLGWLMLIFALLLTP